jgi:L-gulonolactone oxidase
MVCPQHRCELPDLLRSRPSGETMLPIGMMRSYGDTGLNHNGIALDMNGLNRFMSFDPTTGILTAEAGVNFGDILTAFVRRGWFLPVSPGTKFVTLGGAIANDVHGKNHHMAGSLGNFVDEIGLLRSDGTRLTLSEMENAEMFAATIGGLGLTGIIEWAKLRLKPIRSAWFDVEPAPFGSLEEFFDLAEAKAGFEYTVAWVDCQSQGTNLGRGIISSANHAPEGDLRHHLLKPKVRIPFTPPSWLLNRFTLTAFNMAYAARIRRTMKRVEHYDTYLYPLDLIGEWNRLYGPDGFYQYQCVLPWSGARAGIRELMRVIAKTGMGSSLSVLKRFGEISSRGMLSYPMPGLNFALDFTNRGPRTLALMAELDSIVAANGGRLYPAKDGRITAAMFQRSYPLWREFDALRDPGLSSNFWRRVSVHTS